MTMMLFAAGTAIGSLALRPKCAAPVVSMTAAAPPTTVAQVPEPVAIASYAPEIAAVGRNLFAWHPSPRFADSLPASGQRMAEGRVKSHRSPSSPFRPDPPHKREPAYRYLGAFVPTENPILVFKSDGEVIYVPLRRR